MNRAATGMDRKKEREKEREKWDIRSEKGETSAK